MVTPKYLKAQRRQDKVIYPVGLKFIPVPFESNHRNSILILTQRIYHCRKLDDFETH